MWSETPPQKTSTHALSPVWVTRTRNESFLSSVTTLLTSMTISYFKTTTSGILYHIVYTQQLQDYEASISLMEYTPFMFLYN